MSKLFLFAIGGTGARVVKALTFLLSAGIDINASTIIPIIIDPHQGNKDLQRTIDILNEYKYINTHLPAGRTAGFYKTNIQTLKSLTDDANTLNDSYCFGLEGVSNKSFRGYIGYSDFVQEDSNRALCRMLFSDKNLNTPMDIGFVGNPNIGSVVLNQFKDSKEFAVFDANFSPGDRIFIISSIFGGTGAAGFPIILKNIRGAMSNPQVVNKKILADAPIGAISVLPYFGVDQNDESPIDVGTFISKTKAALSYYENNITGANNAVNAMYYLGDSKTRNYNNDSGANGQENNAHFIEVAAALAVIDFMGINAELVTSTDGKAVNPIAKDFGIRNNNDNLGFNDLCDETIGILKKRMSQFQLFRLYYRDELSNAIVKQPWCKRANPHIDETFNGNDLNIKIKSLFDKYDTWLTEMSDNTRAGRTFTPFSTSAGRENLFCFLNGHNAKSSWFMDNYDQFNDVLNNLELHNAVFDNTGNKITELMYRSTVKLLSDRYNI